MGGGERARSAAARGAAQLCAWPIYVPGPSMWLAQLCEPGSSMCAWPIYVPGSSMCACVRAKRAPCGEKVRMRCGGSVEEVWRRCRGSAEGVQRV